MWPVLIDLLGKTWNLPNTLAGLAYGGLGYVVGLLLGRRPSVTFGNNAMQFHDNALMLTAMTLGNVVIYGPARTPADPNVPFVDSPPTHTVGREEFRHTQQGQLLGPFYLPLHLAAGIVSLCRAPHPRLRRPVDRWHRNNFMETGPMCDRVF